MEVLWRAPGRVGGAAAAGGRRAGGGPAGEELGRPASRLAAARSCAHTLRGTNGSTATWKDPRTPTSGTTLAMIAMTSDNRTGP